MPRLRRLAPALLAAALGACGSSPPPTPPAATPATPRPTPLVLRSGPFTLTVPANGWVDLTHDRSALQQLGLSGTVYFLVQHAPPGAFATNRNDVNTDVYALPIAQGYITVAEFPAFLNNTVQAAGGKATGPPVQLTLGGEPGQMVTYTNDLQGTPASHQVVLVDHGLVTYEFLVDSSQYAAGVLASDVQSMLHSLKWSS